MTSERKRSKTWRQATWLKELIEYFWLTVLTHGELRFLLVLVKHCNWDTFTSYPGSKRIQRETKLRGWIWEVIAARLYGYGLLTGRFERRSFGKISWGYLVNPEMPLPDPEKIEKVRNELNQYYWCSSKGVDWTSRRQKLHQYWLKTTPAVKGKPAITTGNSVELVETKERLLIKDTTKTERRYYREKRKAGYTREAARELILMSRRSAAQGGTHTSRPKSSPEPLAMHLTGVV